MVNVNVDDGLIDRVDTVVRKKSIKFPSKKNFVDKAVELQLLNEESDE